MLYYSAGPHEINKGEWTGKIEIRTRKKFLAAGKECIII